MAKSTVDDEEDCEEESAKATVEDEEDCEEGKPHSTLILTF